MTTNLAPRLVSHRLRGFAHHENSLEALDRALAAGVRHVEIDTRVTRDGEILVFHDARFDPLTTGRGPVGDYRFAPGTRPRLGDGGGEPVPTLEEFLAHFAAASPGAELVIDVKDPGAERRHCEILAESGLGARVRIMSWWPEVLLSVHALRPELRLVFSFIPLARAPLWVRAVRLFGDGGPIRVMGRLRGRSRQARYMQDTIFRHAPLLSRPPGGRVRGRYPVCFGAALPEPPLAAALARSGGGIATWPRVVDRALIEEAGALGLEVICFSLDDRDEVRRMLAGPGPALVFTNDPRLFGP